MGEMIGKKLLAFDLDGTLICVLKGSQPGSAVSKENQEALHETAKMGHVNSVITGRSFMDTPKIITENSDIKYIAVSNGSIIRNIRKKCEVHRELIPQENGAKMLSALKGINYSAFLYYPDRMVSSYLDFPKLCSIGKSGNRFPYFRNLKYRLKYLKQTTYVGNLGKYVLNAEDGIAKCDIKLIDKSEAAKAAEKLKQVPGIEFVMFTEKSIEVTAAGVNKGNALRKIAELENISEENIYAFGDSENDLPMRNAAKVLICMGDGCKKLKAVADYISLKSTEHGVAEAIWKLILNINRQ